MHGGEGVTELTEWWGKPVSLVAHSTARPALERLVADAGFAVELSVTRAPDPAIEYPSDRHYLLARRPPG